MKQPLVIHTDPVRYGADAWKQFEKDTGCKVVHWDETYTRDRFIEDLKGEYSEVVAIARGYLCNRRVGLFDKELIEHFPPTLKYIAHQGAGYDQNDVASLTAKGIQLAHCPNIVNDSTADTNIFLMLAAMRNYFQGAQALKEGHWPQRGFGAGVKEGINPKRKVLGIVGMGGIGRNVRDKALPLGFDRIVYYNRSRLSPELEKNSVYCSTLKELCEVADVISVNVPLNKSTHHLINDELISSMKDGVIIVNTARGAIIDEQALIKHLKTGKVSSAGLDVFENEPNVSTELLSLPNVCATPHMGTHAVQTVFDMENCVIENIKSGLQTGKVINLVPEQQKSGLF